MVTLANADRSTAAGLKESSRGTKSFSNRVIGSHQEFEVLIGIVFTIVDCQYQRHNPPVLYLVFGRSDDVLDCLPGDSGCKQRKLPLAGIVAPLSVCKRPNGENQNEISNDAFKCIYVCRSAHGVSSTNMRSVRHDPDSSSKEIRHILVIDLFKNQTVLEKLQRLEEEIRRLRRDLQTAQVKLGKRQEID
jgi:hypothetical protein